MLTIVVPEQTKEYFDEETNTFYKVHNPEVTLHLEHSLLSIAKWESKYCKAFLKSQRKTEEEMFYYIKCMTINKNVDDSVYRNLTKQNIKEINDYINAKMTATHVHIPGQQSNRPGQKDTPTSELIYYWMIACNIPFECQKWHLNRLMALIKVCEAKQTKPVKMSGRSVAKRNHSLNAARRARHHH